MAKFIVQGVKREGFEHIWRGGRAWPAHPVEVEVLEEKDCPTITIEEPGRKARTALHPTRIGQKNWAAIIKDGRLSKSPVGFQETAAEANELRAKVVHLEEVHRDLVAEIDRLNALLVEATARYETAEKALERGQKKGPSPAPEAPPAPPAPPADETAPTEEHPAAPSGEKRSRR